MLCYSNETDKNTARFRYCRPTIHVYLLTAL